MARRQGGEGIANLLSAYGDPDDLEEDEDEDQDIEPVTTTTTTHEETTIVVMDVATNRVLDPLEVANPSSWSGGALEMLRYGGEEAGGSPDREQDGVGPSDPVVEGEAAAPNQGASSGDRNEYTTNEPLLSPPPPSASATPLSASPLPKTPPVASPLAGEAPGHGVGQGDGVGDGRGEMGGGGGAGDAVDIASEQGAPSTNGAAEPGKGNLNDFLPPPRGVGDLSEEERVRLENTQEKFRRYLLMKKRRGMSFNAALRDSKGYRNPDFMQQAVAVQEIDEIGSCFRKHVFDPHGLPEEDYYLELVKQHRRDAERKEQERKAKAQIEFQKGSMQLPTGGMFPLGVPGALPGPLGQFSSMMAVAVAAGVVGAAVTVADAAKQADAARPNKRSKWDKEPGEVLGSDRPSVGRNAQQAQAAARAQLAFINAASQGTAAALQSKRKEGEKEEKSRGRDRERSGKSRG